MSFPSFPISEMVRILVSNVEPGAFEPEYVILSSYCTEYGVLTYYLLRSWPSLIQGGVQFYRGPDPDGSSRDLQLFLARLGSAHLDLKL